MIILQKVGAIMNKKGLLNTSDMDLDIIEAGELSPFDADYHIRFFADSIKRKLRQAENSMQKIYQTVIFDG